MVNPQTPVLNIIDGTMAVTLEGDLLFSVEEVDSAVFDVILTRVLVLKKTAGLPRILQSYALDGSQQFTTSSPDRSRFNYFQRDQNGSIGVVCIEQKINEIGCKDSFFEICEDGSILRKRQSR